MIGRGGARVVGYINCRGRKVGECKHRTFSFFSLKSAKRCIRNSPYLGQRGGMAPLVTPGFATEEVVLIKMFAGATTMFGKYLQPRNLLCQLPPEGLTGSQRHSFCISRPSGIFSMCRPSPRRQWSNCR